MAPPPSASTERETMTTRRSVLVTGGAGFIGSHTVLQLLREGFHVSIIDNLDNSVPEALDRVRALAGPALAQNLRFFLVKTLALSLLFYLSPFSFSLSRL